MSSSAPGGGTRLRPWTYAGLAAVAASALAYQVLLTRIVAVTTGPHDGFAVVSVALLGLAAGALVVHVRPSWFADAQGQAQRQMWRFAGAAAVTAVAGLVVHLLIPVRVELTLVAALSLVVATAALAVPFGCVGVVTGAALTGFPDQVNRVHAALLAGAALGGPLVVVGFRFADGPSLAILVAALAAGGALVLAGAAGDRAGQVVAAGLAVLLGVGGFGNAYQHHRGTPLVEVRWAQGERDPDHVHEEWSVLGRLTVDIRDPGRPPPWSVDAGVSPSCPEAAAAGAGPPGAPSPEGPSHELVVDGAVSTALAQAPVDPAGTDVLRCDVANLGYHALEGGQLERAAVVGVGGGRGLQSALEFGAREVTGFEANGTLLDVLNGTLGEITGHFDRQSQVTLVLDDARSWLSRRGDERFDSIQLSPLTTATATTPVGPFGTVGTPLYTTEAWHLLLERLEPGGLLSVTLPFRQSDGSGAPLGTLRATALAAQVLTERGAANPRNHVLVYEGAPRPDGATVATLLVSPQPLPPQTQERLDAVAEEMGFVPQLTAEVPSADELAAGISPPTDDRPYFGLTMSRRDALGGYLGDGWNDPEMAPALTLATLASVMLLAAGAAVGGPWLAGRRRRGPRPSPTPDRRLYAVYFGGVGLGSVLLQATLVVRLGPFLGRPTYALAVASCAVLAFGAVGSLVVERLVGPRRPVFVLMPLIALLVVAGVTGRVAPQTIEAMAGETTPFRVVVAVALLAPVAGLVGMTLPLGLRMASTSPDTGVRSATALLWAVTSAAAVLGSVLAAAVAGFVGLSAALALGWLSYLAAAVAMAVLAHRRSTPPRPPAMVTAVDVDPDPDADPELMTVP